MAFVMVLPIPDIEIFDDDAFMPRMSKNFLEMRFACDSQSSNTRHGFCVPLWSIAKTLAVDKRID